MHESFPILRRNSLHLALNTLLGLLGSIGILSSISAATCINSWSNHGAMEQNLVGVNFCISNVKKFIPMLPITFIVQLFNYLDF